MKKYHVKSQVVEKSGSQICMQLQYSLLSKERKSVIKRKTPNLNPRTHPPNSQDWHDNTLPRKETLEPQKCAFGTMLTREQTHTHMMHPIPQSPNPKKTQTQNVPGIEGKEPAFPTIPMEREKRRVVRHPQRFRPRRNKKAENQNATNVPPRSTRTAFWPMDTPVLEAARSVFLERQLVAR